MRHVLWPDPASIPELSEHQQQQASRATCKPVGILCGTPGTGKTYTAAALVKATVRSLGDIGSLAVAAPTGKAAVRCSDAMQAYGLATQATTIHRLLGITRNGHDGQGWGFFYCRERPLPYRVIIVDEWSMADTDIAASLFDAIRPGTHVLLVGDPYQLPPVGHGAPLRDMLAGGVPFGELTEIKRNAGSIVQACRAIREGRLIQPPIATEFSVAEGINWRHHETSNVNRQLQTLRHLMESTPGAIDPIWDVQVLCAVNESGELCRERLNVALQLMLNPRGATIPGCPFREGDKVICTSNSMQILHSDENGNLIVGQSQFEVGDDDGEDKEPRRDFVANGEIGRVESITPDFLTIKFFGPRRTILIPLRIRKRAAAGESEKSNTTEKSTVNGKSLGQSRGNVQSRNNGNDTGNAAANLQSNAPAKIVIPDFELAYAITVHKAQGSQAPVIISLIDDSRGAAMVTSREWWYTAASRAEKLWVTVGQIGTLNKQCRRIALQNRKTFLKERLQESGESSSSCRSAE